MNALPRATRRLTIRLPNTPHSRGHKEGTAVRDHFYRPWSKPAALAVMLVASAILVGCVTVVPPGTAGPWAETQVQDVAIL